MPRATASAIPPSDPMSLDRVVVIGTSGAGKSAFAGRLARLLDREHIELDELYWDRNWQPKSATLFRDLVARAVAQPRWIADGNYSSARDLVWRRATTVI